MNIHYLVGNHDWFYHLPGPVYDQLRQEIVDTIGLVTPPPPPVPPNPDTEASLQALYEPYRLLARHGDIYDPFTIMESGRSLAGRCGGGGAAQSLPG